VRAGRSSWLLALVTALALPAIAMVGEAEVKAKAKALAQLLVSPTAQSIDGANEDKPRALLAEARSHRDLAQAALAQNKLDDADQHLTKALGLISQATVLASWRKSADNAKAARYRDTLESIALYRDSFADAAKPKGPAAFRLLDQAKLDQMLAQAKTHAGANRFDEANHLLSEALALVETAVVRLRDNETVTYNRDFATPRDEFRFESERLATYQSLLPRLIAERGKGAGAEARERVFQLKDESERLHTQALGEAGKGDYFKAISLLVEAQNRLLAAAQALGAM
jgi:hypothetical protein